MDIFYTLIGLVEISWGEEKAEVKDWIFDSLVVVVDLLEVVKSCLFDYVIFFDSFNRVKMRYFKCEYIDTGGFEDKFVLMFYASLVGIEKGQKLSVARLLFFLIIFLFGVLFTAFIFFCFLSFG